jgi:hypothetical protein
MAAKPKISNVAWTDLTVKSAPEVRDPTGAIAALYEPGPIEITPNG